MTLKASREKWHNTYKWRTFQISTDTSSEKMHQKLRKKESIRNDNYLDKYKKFFLLISWKHTWQFKAKIISLFCGVYNYVDVIHVTLIA